MDDEPASFPLIMSFDTAYMLFYLAIAIGLLAVAIVYAASKWDRRQS